MTYILGIDPISDTPTCNDYSFCYVKQCVVAYTPYLPFKTIRKPSFCSRKPCNSSKRTCEGNKGLKYEETLAFSHLLFTSKARQSESQISARTHCVGWKLEVFGSLLLSFHAWEIWVWYYLRCQLWWAKYRLVLRYQASVGTSLWRFGRFDYL